MVLAARDCPARRGAVAPRAIGPRSSAGGHPCRRVRRPRSGRRSRRRSRRRRAAVADRERSCATIAVALPLAAVLDVLLEDDRSVGGRLPRRSPSPCWRARRHCGCAASGPLDPGRRRPRHRGRAARRAAMSSSQPRSCCDILSGPHRSFARECSTRRRRLPERSRAPTVVPLWRPAVLAAVALGFAAALVTGVPGVRPRALCRPSTGSRARQAAATSGAPAVLATIVPPAYTHEPARTFRNPERIEAVQGSRLSLTVRGGGAWRVRFGTDALVATVSGDATVVDLTLSRSGYLAIEPQDRDASASRRLASGDGDSRSRADDPHRGARQRSPAAGCHARRRSCRIGHRRLRAPVARAALHARSRDRASSSSSRRDSSL